jgi:hypothetical protein
MGLFFFDLSLKALSSAVCADSLPYSRLFLWRIEDPIANFLKGAPATLADLIIKSGADSNAG